MDDLTGKLMEMLNNPESIEKIKNLTGLLGKNDESKNETTPENQDTEESQLEALPVDAINTITKLMPILSSMNKDDEKTRFLGALRPLLSDNRKKKLDESVKILQMIQVLPLLKGQGII
ncbi:MAG: hypothetical protein RUMPE_00164 [Eubacteriales bacterium SKADARSKE-1]|nr:hypothetical protein [Eubacteriales bacterium SKADARSKE-1]